MRLLAAVIMALTCLASAASGAEPAAVPGLHQLEWEAHRDWPTTPELIGPAGPRSLPQPLTPRSFSPCRTVFGYLPYWESSANIQWDLLTHVAAFSVEVNADGTLGNLHGWPWTALVNTAHANGVKVVLVATLFDTNSALTLVSTPAYRQAFYANIKNQMLEGAADGINIDFEGGGDWRAYINDFMAELTAYMHAEAPGSEVTFAGPAVNWGGGWDLPGLAASCDGIFIMGYAFYGSWSSSSGPNAPLTGGSINITNTVLTQYYPVAQATPEKLILGVPYYGGHWTTTTSAARAPVVAWQGSTRFYNDVVNAQTHGRQWEALSQTPWYVWWDGANWHQVWYDDAESLGLKYQLAADNNLAGVGMWALNYDRTRPELWETIRTHFVDSCCAANVDTAGLTVFADDFDDGASATRWGLLASSGDYSADFAFDYSAAGIPPAPHTAGGTTTGLKFTVNNNDADPAAAAVSAYPLGISLGSDHALTFDMWINYNGGAGGGAGSTEFMIAGLGQSGAQVVWPNNPASDGYAVAVSGEGGAAEDYRVYDGAAMFSAASGVYVAGNQNNTAAFYQSLFATPPYETTGAPGKRWVAVEVRHVGGVLQWRLNGTLVAGVNVPALSGNVMLGYLDPFSSIASPAADNFIVYDNARVALAPELDCNGNGTPDGCEAIARGDYDADGDVDADDLNWLADCLAGPTAAPLPANVTCASRCLGCFDSDQDGDLDLTDFAAFQLCYSGSGNPIPATCPLGP